MKRLLLVAMGLLVLTLISWANVDHLSAAERLTLITENVYAYVDTRNGSPKNSFGANAGIIIGADGIVVVDAMASAKEAKRFIRDIQAISRKPIKYLINTHYHFDHALGNSEFVKIGAVAVAQENASTAMEKTAKETLRNITAYGLTAEDMEGTEASYPTIIYGDRMTIDMGGEKVELIHSRYAHTDGDTLVYLPTKKTLFVGDILFTDYHPFLAEGNIGEWAKELDDIKAMDVEKIIPGHGPLSTKRDLDDMKAYIVKFDQKAKELASQLDDIQKITAAIQNALPSRPEGAWTIPANIRMKYVKKP